MRIPCEFEPTKKAERKNLGYIPVRNERKWVHGYGEFLRFYFC